MLCLYVCLLHSTEMALLRLSRSNICPKSILGTQIYTAFSSTTVYYSTQSQVFILKGDVPSGPLLPLSKDFWRLNFYSELLGLNAISWLAQVFCSFSHGISRRVKLPHFAVPLLLIPPRESGSAN